jgi:hypothetical protein
VPIRASVTTNVLIFTSLAAVTVVSGLALASLAIAAVVLLFDGPRGVTAALRAESLLAATSAPQWLVVPAWVVGFAFGTGLGVILWRGVARRLFPQHRHHIDRAVGGR